MSSLLKLINCTCAPSTCTTCSVLVRHRHSCLYAGYFQFQPCNLARNQQTIRRLSLPRAFVWNPFFVVGTEHGLKVVTEHKDNHHYHDLLKLIWELFSMRIRELFLSVLLSTLSIIVKKTCKKLLIIVVLLWTLSMIVSRKIMQAITRSTRLYFAFSILVIAYWNGASTRRCFHCFDHYFVFLWQEGSEIPSPRPRNR